MLKYLIAFILGYFVCRHMGNGFSVGGKNWSNCKGDFCMEDSGCKKHGRDFLCKMNWLVGGECCEDNN